MRREARDDARQVRRLIDTLRQREIDPALRNRIYPGAAESDEFRREFARYMIREQERRAEADAGVVQSSGAGMAGWPRRSPAGDTGCAIDLRMLKGSGEDTLLPPGGPSQAWRRRHPKRWRRRTLGLL